MLYDPKWEQKTETKPTFAGFVRWLELQPPDETYSWGSCDNCAIAQYLRTFGMGIRNLSYPEYNKLEGGNPGRHGQVAMGMPHTFGAALARARAALPR